MTPAPIRVRSAAIALMIAATIVAGCTQSKTNTSPPASPTPSATPSPSPVYLSPLSGLVAAVGEPVVVVKIDNSEASHPQAGLNDADVVYMEQVEGGLTRLAAVFSTHLPVEAGPARSARESDIELLGAYGNAPLAFSGANRGVVNLINNSRLVNASWDRVTSAYRRVNGRRAPYDLFVHPQEIAKAKADAAKAKNIGLTFGDVSGGQLVSDLSTRIATAKVAFHYDSPSKKWALSMDNRPSLLVGGAPVSADNVIVQFIRVRGSRFSDVNGNVSPYSITTGLGPAIIFRDGRRFNATWKRPAPGDPTHYIGGNGLDVPLKAGTTWILLATIGEKLNVTEVYDPTKASASPSATP